MLEQGLHLLRHRERRDRLPQARWSVRADGWMAGIDDDRAPGKRVLRIDRRRPAKLEYQIAAAPMRAVAPHATGQRERNRDFVCGGLRVAHARDVRIGAAVLHPVDVRLGAVQPQRETPFLFFYFEWHASGKRHAQDE